jgi:hypothetical protein
LNIFNQFLHIKILLLTPDDHGKQIRISPSVDRLVPAVSILYDVYLFPSIEANFGDDKDKPFQYDIRNCPGMGLDCI